MADGSVPLVLSPEPFSREVAYLEQPAGRTLRAALLDAVKSGAIAADDLSRTVVYIDGQRLERDQTLDHVLVEGEIVNVVVEPLGGGGGKDIGQILMTIAVIAVSMWVGGPAGAAALGSQMLARVAAAAILTLGQAAVAAIFAPETDNKAKTNERYALQTASNQYRPWAPQPIALGEVVVAPDFAAKTYTQSVGDDVWLHGILGLHRGPCTVADLKIGDTLASSMGAGDFRMVEHLTPGPRTFTIYPNDADQLDLQEELEATTLNATPVVRAGSAEGEQFDFDFFLPGGLHFQKDDGRLLTAFVIVYIRYRPVDAAGNPTGSGSWSTGPTVALSSTTKEPMRVTRSASLPMGRYEFEFVRSLKPDDNEKRRDRIALTAIRSIAYRKPVADETLSIIEFAVRATALNQGTLAPITCRIIPICETWNGSAWGSPAPTSNPAALARWFLTGPAPARPLLPEQADTRLRAWSGLCQTYNWRAGLYLQDERRQDQVLALLEQSGRASLFWDGTQIVASPWVEKPAPRQLFTGSNLRDHKWTLVYPEPVHALRVEFQNIEEGGDPDEIYVYADGYAETAGPGVQPATLVEALRLEGQKTPERAYRDGRWELGARLHRRRIDTWTADVEHLVSSYGDRVRLAWQRVEGGTSTRIRCRRWSGGLVSGLRLAQPVEMKPGESYAADIRLPSGVALAVPLINVATDAPVITREVQFAVPRAPEQAPRRDDLIAFGVPARISEDTEIIGVEPGEGLTAVMTGVRYVAPLLMAGEIGPIPPLQTRLSRIRQASPPSPTLLGVQNDPAGVRVSFTMPPWAGSPISGFAARWRPTPAPGQESGWVSLPGLEPTAGTLVTPPPRALPVAQGDSEGATLIDVEVRALTEAGHSSPVPLMVSAIEVREDPFSPTGLAVTPATRVAPGGSSHGVLVVGVAPLAAAQGIELVLECRRAPMVGAPDPWESAGLPLAAANPTGDILGLRSGERYGVRAAWRSAGGWVSQWTNEVRATVPAGSNVSDDTANINGMPSDLFVSRVIDVESLAAANATGIANLVTVYGSTASAAASAAAAALSEAAAIIAAAASDASAATASTQAGIATSAASAAGGSASAASTSAGAAASSATSSASSAAASQTSRLAAEAANSAAGTSASAAATSASAASSSASAAGSSASAANTSATNAATSAGSASTSATNSSSSATTAAGHAVSAFNSATASANSAGLAGGSATAASGSASSAATSATAASNSASAASASQVAAASSYSATVMVGGNQDFAAGITGYTVVGGPLYAVPGIYGRSQLALTSASVTEVYSQKKWPFNPARKYKIEIAVFLESGAGISLDAGFAAYDAAGNFLAHNPGSYAYVAAVGVVAPMGVWTTYRSPVITPEGPGVYGYPPGTAQIALLYIVYQVNNASPTNAYVDYLRLEDVTESEAAATSASAAVTSASSAATSASAAGSSATAASGSATTAATQAGNASTFAGQASTSAGNAASSSSSAGTSASNASSSAATASTQASNAAGSAASASSSAILAATVGTSSLLSNPRFSNYPAVTGVPPSWDDWANGSTGTRASGEAGGYAYILTGGAGASAGISQNTVVGSAKDGDYVVIEADVYLASGALTGAGCLLYVFNSAIATYQDLDLIFSTTPDSTGVAPGAGSAGRTYRFSKLVRVAKADASLYRLYGMSHFGSFGSIAAANQLYWYKNLVRAATAAEIAAGVALPALSASVSTLQTTVANHETQYALARYQVSATTPGGAAVLSLVSSTYGTVAGLSADKIYFGENTFFDDATDTLRTTTGANVRVIALGASFGTDGQLTEWEGPAATAFASMSRANAYFYKANVAPHAGGSALAPAFSVSQSHTGRVGTRFGAGSVTTSVVTLTPTGNTGAVSYTWANVFGDSTLGPTAATSAATAFNGAVAANQQKQAQFAWTATDAGTGRTVTGYCAATILDAT